MKPVVTAIEAVRARMFPTGRDTHMNYHEDLKPNSWIETLGMPLTQIQVVYDTHSPWVHVSFVFEVEPHRCEHHLPFKREVIASLDPLLFLGKKLKEASLEGDAIKLSFGDVDLRLRKEP